MEVNDINLKDLIEKETGERFNRQGYIPCPFHKDKSPSLSIKFHPDTNKHKFKCFGCDVGGDSIDFISKLKGLDFIGARKYLGMKVEKSKNELLQDQVKKFINWELGKYRENQELLGLFTFVDKDNNPIYFKGKFIDHSTGKKKHGYYHLEKEKVIATREHDEVPYNFYNVIKGIEADKVIIIVEGEKDANTINSLLKNENFVATSFKGITKEINYFVGAKVYVCGDTGVAGEQYKWKIHKELYLSSIEFKFINLPGLKALGNNKDVTDWIECGHNKKDLLNAFNRNLDLKSRYEFQQDPNGVYKWFYGKDEKWIKIYVTNFKILEAKRIKFIDEDKEGIKLIMKSNTGETFERIGLATVFDDVRAFRNFLGTMDLSLIDPKLLTDFKIWINRFFALENETIHNGMKFIIDNNETMFITNKGSITTTGTKLDIKSNNTSSSDITEVERISKDEFKELRKYLFKFASSEKTISIIGTIINNLAVAQNKELKHKLHHLLIVGESGSGKSTILENVIGAILNTSKNDIKSIGLTSPFGIIKSLSDGNYPLLLEEFKPSSLDRFKISKLSEIFRNAYDRVTVSKGNRSLETIEFKLDRPMIIVGEESYPNSEKALIERSCIVYLSKLERVEEHSKSMKWLIENEVILNKLGRSLIDIILNLSCEDYAHMREIADSKIIDLSNRPLTTAINIHCGMQILNKLALELGIKEFRGFEKHLIQNIKTEVLEDGEEVNSVSEKMLVEFNSMLEDGRVAAPDTVKLYKNHRTFIKTSEMINLIYEHSVRFGTDIIPLKLKDFRKQAKKSGYIIAESVPTKVSVLGKWKTIRFDEYDTQRLRNLNLYEVVEIIAEAEKDMERITAESDSEINKEINEFIKTVNGNF